MLYYFILLVKTLPGNLVLSDQAFLEKFNRQKPLPQDELIFSCRSGKRAGEACEMATQLGFKK